MNQCFGRVQATPVLRAKPVNQGTTMIRPGGLNLQQQSPYWGIPLANYNCPLLPIRTLTSSRDAHASSDSDALGQVRRSDRKKPQQLWDKLMSGLLETKHQRHGQQVLMSLATRIKMDQANITKEMVS